VPFIFQTLRHVRLDSSAGLPISIPRDARGARVFGRHVLNAKNADHFDALLKACIWDSRLPRIAQAFIRSSETRLYLDPTHWVMALGEQQRGRHAEFEQHMARCMHLTDCLASLFRAIGVPMPDTDRPLPTPGELTTVAPVLRQAIEGVLRFFVASAAIGEILIGQSVRDYGVKARIAQTIVESTDAASSFLFGLASALSTSLGTKSDPVLLEIMQNEDLFRRSFDTRNEPDAKTYTLGELEAKLLEA